MERITLRLRRNAVSLASVVVLALVLAPSLRPAAAQGPSALTWENFPGDAAEDLRILAPAGIRAFALAPTGGYAIVTHDNRTVARGALPPDFIAAFNRLNQDGVLIRSIAFGPEAGWVIMFDQGTRFGGIHPDCVNALGGLAQRGERHLSVALGEGGTWVVVSDRSFFTGGMPPEFNDRLNAFAGNGGVAYVALSPRGGASVFANGTRCNTRALPVGCDRRIAQASINGESIDIVAFTREGGWIVVTSRR